MAKLKKLIQPSESRVVVESPLSDSEIKSRALDYPNLTFSDFSKKHRKLLFEPVNLSIKGNTYSIQSNFCINPFCRWYGLPQHSYKSIKYKPSRYWLSGVHNNKKITCMNVPVAIPEGITFTDDYVTPMSNWSLAQEIKRLSDINTLKPLKSNDEYVFHKDDCCDLDKTPFKNPELFLKRGKSSSNSQKYQCKTCGKMTNVLPDIRKSFSYNQQRNDILPDLFMQIVNRTPVTRTLELLNIGSSTYYNKLEWIHRRCLEFLEKHETKALKDKEFDTLWLNTDKFIYYLNNIRKKGYGDNYAEQEVIRMPTHIVATVDAWSRYTFRNDIAYDFEIKLDEIEADIALYKEDKLDTFEQKNARYRYARYGNRKFKKEDFVEDVVDDILDFSYLDLRRHYVDGLHVNSSYTAYAQYWHIKNLLNVKKLNFVCDDDRTLLNGMLRVFSEEIKNHTTNIYTCQVEKSLTKVEAYREYVMRKEELDEFQKATGITTRFEAATVLLAQDLTQHDFYKVVLLNGKEYAIPDDDTPVQHPMPFTDEGIRYVKPVTNLYGLTNYEMAKELMNVNSRAINTYFNQMRRRCSLFERPLVTARGDGKSYIYANFNPRYAHYMLTIIRTYINFCDTYKYKKKDVTPAMRLGIADKPYTVHDILYFK